MVRTAYYRGKASQGSLPLHRKAGVLAGLALYLVAASGVPLPRPRAVSLERFPCEASQCGCRTARQCWLSCCCHSSLEQRLAWARRERVALPGYVVALLESRDASSATDTFTTANTRGRTSCCGARDDDTSGTCPSVAEATTKAANCCGKASRGVKSSRDRSVIAIQAFRCQGLAQSLVFLAALVVPVPAPILELEVPPGTWIDPVLTERAASISLAPAVPPPEAGCST
jgi:hypothetical protein